MFDLTGNMRDIKFESPINALSLFDGMSCGQIALERVGIQVAKYYASEIEKQPIQITQKNYPNTIHLGDVCKVNAKELDKIDLLIAGSPCQGFSFAGKQLAFDDPRSKLFFEFVRILKECKEKNPDLIFLLENVRMKKEHEDVITRILGVFPICINSALVSAQNRVRYYWTNIPGITQPEDRGVLLRDILEDTKPTLASRIVGRKINPESGKRDDENQDLKTEQRIEVNANPDKANCLTSVQKDNILLFDFSKYSPKRKRNYIQFDISGKGYGSQQNRVFFPEGKHGTLSATRAESKAKVLESKTTYRKLTLIECERLQTIPDNYTEGVSNSARYKMLGNGWTVDVISHIFKGLTK